MKLLATTLMILGCCSCEHGAKEGSISSRTQYLFNLDKNQKSWPKGYYVESTDPLPEVHYRETRIKVEGKKLFGTCGYWEIQKKGKWIK